MTLGIHLRFLMDTVKTLLFPPSCSFCGASINEYYSLCSNCWFSLQFINRNVCRYCGESLVPGESGCEKYPKALSTQCCELCQRLGGTPLRSNTLSCLVYDDFSKPHILRLKEHNDPHLALVFARFFHKTDFIKMDYLIPVPLHPLRLCWRTYNQAALLVLGIRKWNQECPTIRFDLLKRIRPTPQQKGRNARERRQNVRNQIIVPPSKVPDVRGKRIAIVDDVVASGATLSECCRVLLEAGASEVRCLALAQT